MEIILVNQKISKEVLKKACETWFATMVKVVVDIAQNRLALGGDLHSDAEVLLLNSGSIQDNLWGANFYPWEPPENRIEYSALINIRPGQNNRGMEIEDAAIRDRVKEIIENLLLGADELLA